MKGHDRVVGESRWVNVATGIVASTIGLVFFFPVLYMVLNSFKSEQDANTSPKLLFDATLDRYREVTESAGGLLSFGTAFANSAMVVLASTAVVLLLAIPAAYALAIRPVQKWRDILFFFISTKFLPVVASILPLWIIARELNLLNTRWILIILYTGMNLPLAVWMLRSFFKEIPRELIEAAEIDGASLRGQLQSIILPMAAPGIAATALLDRDVSNVRPRDRDIAMVFQNYALYPQLTVAENMGFALKQQGVQKDERKRRVQETARILDLEPYLDASRRTSRAASASAWPWAARSSGARPSTSWTSRSRTSMPSSGCRPGRSSSSCRPGSASRRSTSRTTRSRR